MAVRLVHGISPTTAAEQLQRVQGVLSDSMAGPYTATDRLEAYRRWSNTALWMLQTTFTPSAVRQLIQTENYVLLHQVSTLSPSLQPLLDAEISARQNALEAERRQLVHIAEAWRNSGFVVVPDTSLLLNHPNDVSDIPWRDIAESRLERVDVVILMKVVEELDKAKSAPQSQKVRGDESVSLRTRARTTLRDITAAFRGSTRGVVMLTRGEFAANQPDVYWRLGLDDLTHTPLPVPDAEIVDRAAAVRDLSQAIVTVATADTGMTLRAGAEDLRTYLWTKE